MLTPPDLSHETILAVVREAYGVRGRQAAFLPIGADVNAAVYRVEADDGVSYFLKLRRGDFDEMAVAIPAFLRAQGIAQIMAPLPTSSQRLWTSAQGFEWMLYPFFESHNAYDVALSDAQWVALGESLRAVHSVTLPPQLAQRVPKEDYSPRWRDIVRAFDQQVEAHVYDDPADPIAAKLAAFWMAQRHDIRAMVARADELGRALQRRPIPFVLCHADMHPGNILLGADDALAIVDWDNPIFAAKERDLMAFGGGMAFVVEGPREEALFARGYGATERDPAALAYYRYERIVADVAAYGEQIFGAQGSEEDRELGLRQLMSQFLPHQVVAIAHQTYERLP
jgi:spectinomycin phosphotransferase